MSLLRGSLDDILTLKAKTTSLTSSLDSLDAQLVEVKRDFGDVRLEHTQFVNTVNTVAGEFDSVKVKLRVYGGVSVETYGGVLCLVS